MNARRGDYITFRLPGLPIDEATRQGLYLGDGEVKFEVPDKDGVWVVDVADIYAVVPDQNLLPDTLRWVKAWRLVNIP